MEKKTINSAYNYILSFSLCEQILLIHKERFGELLETMLTTWSISKEM